jgi:biopolymer transport protein ExbD
MRLRRQRPARRGRIEIIPMIDVMFFLLATFMLASLTMQNLHSLHVDLPEGKADPLQAHSPLTISVTREGVVYLNEVALALNDLAPAIKAMLRSDDDIIVSADTAAPEGVVVQAMLRAREAGAQHFLIAVKRD